MTLQEAARSYVYPIRTQNHFSNKYANPNFYKDQEKKYGTEIWTEACIKARLEYDFGSTAVKW